MSEILFNKTIALEDGGPAVVTEFNVAQDVAGPWSVLALSVGGGNNVTLKLDRLLLGEADELVAPGAIVADVLSVFDETVAFTRLRVTLTPGVTAPTGGVKLQLLGTRNR